MSPWGDTTEVLGVLGRFWDSVGSSGEHESRFRHACLGPRVSLVALCFSLPQVYLGLWMWLSLSNPAVSCCSWWWPGRRWDTGRGCCRCGQPGCWGGEDTDSSSNPYRGLEVPEEIFGCNGPWGSCKSHWSRSMVLWWCHLKVSWDHCLSFQYLLAEPNAWLRFSG